MAENNYNVEALTTILSVLKELDADSQRRTIQAVITFLDIHSNVIALNATVILNENGSQKNKETNFNIFFIVNPLHPTYF